MKRINQYFEVFNDCIYDLPTDDEFIIKSGRAVILNGGRADILNGGRADILNGGRADIWNGGHADILNGGRADILNGGHADILNGGRAVILNGGRADIWNGGHADILKDLPILAESDGYQLRRSSDSRYYAGCRSALTAAEALAHWDREDDRACLFTLAIGIAENTMPKGGYK